MKMNSREQMSRNELRYIISSADPEDATLFCRIIALSIINLFNGSYIALAEFFGMSNPSVRRWVDGKNPPHSIMIAHMYQLLIVKCLL